MEIWYTLTGDIEKKGVQDAIAWLNGELYSKPVERLRLLLASGGGDVASGINLYMYLKALPIEVETIGFGEIDFAAIPIFLGGKRRIAVRECQFIFHEGRYEVEGRTVPLSTFEETVTEFRRELRQTMLLIAKETGNDMELVSAMLRRGKTMQADEAKEFGLCHAIIETLPLQQQEKGIGFQQRAEKSPWNMPKRGVQIRGGKRKDTKGDSEGPETV